MKELTNIYAEKLKGISGELISQDKKDAVYKLPISRTSLDKYLRGDVSKIETAKSLYEFLSKKVNSRMEQAMA